MDSEKLEIIAVRKIEEYIGNCPRLELSIQFNDETPIWDEDIIVYNNEKNKSLESFVGRIPVRIKGMTNTKDDFYRIDRNYLKAWATEKGGFFFIVQEDLRTFEPLRVLYALITLNDVYALLRQNSKVLKLQLKEIPADYYVFEEQVVDFARKKNELEISSFDPKDLIPIKKDCEKFHLFIHSITPNQREYFKQLLDKTKSFIIEESFDWHDTFIQNIQGILEIAQSNKIDDYALLRDISTKFAHFLKVLKRYVLAEKYLKVAKNYAQSLAEKHPEAIFAVTESVENLVKLYQETVVLEPEQEVQPLHLQSCETNPTSYLDLARDYYNLAYRFVIKNRQRDAEKNFIKALDLYILLAETNQKEAKRHIEKIFDILDKLHEIHKKHRNYSEAERDVSEAKGFLGKSTVLDSDTDQILQAKWLAKSAFLNKALKRFEDAKREYQKSLRIYDSMRAKDKKIDTIIEKTQIKISLADLYSQMGKCDKAKILFNESIETYNNLKNKKIIPSKIRAFYEFAKYYARINKKEEAKSKYDEAYKLQQKLNNHDDFAIDQADTLMALAIMYKQGDLEESGKTYGEALGILSRLVKKDPEANIYILMDFLNNSSTIYDSFGTSKEKATFFLKSVESKYEDLLEICAEQENKDQIIFKEVRDIVLYCLAHLYDITGNHMSAKKEYKELLDLRYEIAKLRPDKKKGVALTLIDLGKLYSIPSSSSSDLYEAVDYYEEALKIFQNLSRDDNSLDNDRASLHNLLSNLYYSRNLRSEAEIHYKHYLELSPKEQDKNHKFFTEILDNSTLVNTLSHEYPLIICKNDKSE